LNKKKKHVGLGKECVYETHFADERKLN